MGDLVTALGLVLAIEGALYAAFPGGMQQMMRQAVDMPPNSLRTGGLIALGVGVAIVWLVRG